MDLKIPEPLQYVAPEKVARLVDVLSIGDGEDGDPIDSGVPIYTIQPASTAAEFFSNVIKSLPTNPKLSGQVHWDGLRDSLFNGIDDLDVPCVAIIWLLPNRLFEANPDDYEIAVDVLATIVRDFEQEAKDGGRPVQLLIYLTY